MAKQLGLIFDLKRCIGCESCVIACKLEHNHPVGVNWMRVDTLEMDGGAGGGGAGAPKMSFRPATCMHCRAAPCLDDCAYNAITRRKDGIVVLNTRQCTGCQTCMTSCPYNVIQFDQERQLASKCDLCNERIDRGEEPFCARECPTQAIHFGDVSEPEGKAGSLVSRRGGYALNPEKGTKPSNRYLE